MKLISKILLVLIITLTLVTLLAIFADEIRSVAGLPNPDVGDEQTGNTETHSHEISLGSLQSQLELEEIRNIVINLNAEQQKELLANPDTFKNFIQQQQTQKAVLGLVKQDKVDEVPAVRFLMQKSAEKALIDWYMGQLIKKNLPADFPTEEQIKEFYAANQERFVVDDRLHLWQIFMPFSAQTPIDEIKSIELKAKQVHKDLTSDKLSFADAAREHSSDSPSRENGGYIGLINIKDLLPVVKDNVLKLDVGEISQPFKTEKGVHIVRRGTMVDSQVVEYEQIREQIQKVLLKQATEEIRRTVIEKAQEKLPNQLNEQTIEEWRIKLRAGM